jgi:hypothetical protein
MLESRHDPKIHPDRRPEAAPGTVEVTAPGNPAHAEWAAAGLDAPDLDVMRHYRLGRLRAELARRDFAGALLYDPLNIRYATDAANMQVWWRGAFFVLALTLSLFHLYTSIFAQLPSHQQRTFHLAFGLGLTFLLYPAKMKFSTSEARRSWIITGLILAGLGYLVATGDAGLHTVLPAVVVVLLVLVVLFVDRLVLVALEAFADEVAVLVRRAARRHQGGPGCHGAHAGQALPPVLGRLLIATVLQGGRQRRQDHSAYVDRQLLLLPPSRQPHRTPS